MGLSVAGLVDTGSRYVRACVRVELPEAKIIGAGIPVFRIVVAFLSSRERIEDAVDARIGQGARTGRSRGWGWSTPMSIRHAGACSAMRRCGTRAAGCAPPRHDGCAQRGMVGKTLPYAELVAG